MGTPGLLAYARRYHLVRSDALSALRDDYYFYRRVREKEKFWNLRLAARARCRRLLIKILSAIRFKCLCMKKLKEDFDSDKIEGIDPTGLSRSFSHESASSPWQEDIAE